MRHCIGTVASCSEQLATTKSIWNRCCSSHYNQTYMPCTGWRHCLLVMVRTKATRRRSQTRHKLREVRRAALSRQLSAAARSSREVSQTSRPCTADPMANKAGSSAQASTKKTNEHALTSPVDIPTPSEAADAHDKQQVASAGKSACVQEQQAHLSK